MAKFGENIFEFKSVFRLNRIPVTCVDDHWFIRTGQSSIIRVQDSKILHTWTLVQGHLHCFSSPVAYLDGNLYCVMDRNVLMRWSIDAGNLENAEKFQLQELVYSIIPLDGVPPLVIFESGKFAVIDADTFYDFKPSDSICMKENEILHWADATVSALNIEVFYVVFDKEEKNYTLYYFTVNKKDKSVSPLHTYNLFHKSASFKSCCLNQDVSFISLWSDGTVQCYNVRELKEKPILSVQDIDEDTITSIDSIDSTHIVIAKIISKCQGCRIEIWDSRSTILKGRKDLKMPCLNYLQVAAINDHIFINLVVKLVAIPFVVDPTFFSTLNISESKEFQQHLWCMDLELVQIPTNNEPEEMDTSVSNQDSQDSVELVIEKLLKRDSHDLMFIPESELVKILQLVTNHKKGENSDQKCFGKDMYSLLNIIFSASFNDTLLVKYLKRLNVEDTLIALDLLLSYLKHTVNMPTDIHERPSDLKIVNWMCLMISSHTEVLLFTKERATRKLLKNLKKALSGKMEEYEDLEGIQSYFSILQKKDILPQKYSVEKYSLETLDI